MRAVDDATNFRIKVGEYKFLTGYRIYKSSANISEQVALFAGESEENVFVFERARSSLAIAGSLLVALATLQWF